MKDAQIGDMHEGLRKAKSSYCSTPEWLPARFRRYIENRAWFVCKVHDNSCGWKGKAQGISLTSAHYTFLKGILLKSKLPIWFRPIFIILAMPVIIWRGRGDYKEEG